MRVEAVFKRDVGSGYYPGRLSVDNGDGTWAVDFDDGDAAFRYEKVREALSVTGVSIISGSMSTLVSE